MTLVDFYAWLLFKYSMFEKWGLLKLSENTKPILKVQLFTFNIYFLHFWIIWFRWDTLSSFVPGSGNALQKRHTLPLWKDTHSTFTRGMYSLCVCTPFCLFIMRLNDAFTYEYKQSSFTELQKDTKHQWTQLNGSKGLWMYQHVLSLIAMSTWHCGNILREAGVLFKSHFL